MSNIYCGLEEKAPKGKVLGSMKQCLEKKQVRRFGRVKVDRKTIDSSKSGKSLPESRDKLLLMLVGLRGSIRRHKGRINSKDEKIAKESKAILADSERKLKKVVAKIKSLEKDVPKKKVTKKKVTKKKVTEKKVTKKKVTKKKVVKEIPLLEEIPTMKRLPIRGKKKVKKLKKSMFKELEEGSELTPLEDKDIPPIGFLKKMVDRTGDVEFLTAFIRKDINKLKEILVDKNPLFLRNGFHERLELMILELYKNNWDKYPKFKEEVLEWIEPLAETRIRVQDIDDDMNIIFQKAGGALNISGLAPTMDHYLKDFHMTRKDDIMNRRGDIVVPIDHRMLSMSRHS